MYINGTYINKVIFNGNVARKALFNGIVVWQSSTVPLDTITPTMPEYLMESNVTENSIEVLWMDNIESDLLGYNVYLNGVKQNDLPITMAIYTFEALMPETSYLIAVSAVDTSGNESEKTSITVTTIAQQQPQKPKVIVSDSFNRTDSASLGIADTGQTWSTIIGGLGIKNNMAYSTSTATSLSVIDIAQSNCIVSCKLATIGTSSATRVAFRVSNNNNLLYLDATKNIEYHFSKRVGGVITQIATIPAIPKDGDIVKVEFNNSDIKIFINDVLGVNITVNDFITYTKFGLYSSGYTDQRFDDLKIEEVI